MFKTIQTTFSNLIYGKPKPVFDPADKLSEEVFCLVMTRLDEVELSNACLVSTTWAKLIDLHLFRPRCLTPKIDSISWRMHFLRQDQPRRFAQQEKLPPKELATAIARGNSTLLLDQNKGFACFVFNQMEERSYDYRFHIWDMKSDPVMSNITCHTENEAIHEVAFGYPYLLTKTKDHFYIRNVSNDSYEPFLKYPLKGEMKDFSINSHGFTYISDPLMGPKTKIYFVRLAQDKTAGYLIPEDMKTDLPVTLLHNNLLIYTEIKGVLKVRDVTKEGYQICGDLEAPELLSRIEELKVGMDTSAMRVLLDEYNVTSLAADGLALVTASSHHLFLWNLENCSVIRRFAPLHSSLSIDQLAGHTLIVHDPRNIIIFDLTQKDRLFVLAEWINNNRDSCLKPAGYYQGKFYVVSKLDANQIALKTFQ